MKKKKLHSHLGAVGALLLTLTIPLQQLAAGPSTETFKQNEQGLEKQFDGFLKAYHKGDDKGMEAAFGIFRLPKPKEWFAGHFSTEDAVQLDATYGKQVTDAQNALIEDMNTTDPGSRFHVRCESRGVVASGTGKAGSSSIQPVKPVQVEQFVMEFTSGDGKKFLFLANFVYEDGAYRFVGGGGGPFWGDDVKTTANAANNG